ncbi:hypothetical protein rosag_47930 [Roseisolibacter agri]|uniref:Uncharacterized protein n=1 Tax=Roseisolibacter agri TaxID=2014610 RepID=A0AA37Q811_9BACT|nr:hypothetical protein rosag_47930 [Roseisolibacter agri]
MPATPGGLSDSPSPPLPQARRGAAGHAAVTGAAALLGFFVAAVGQFYVWPLGDFLATTGLGSSGRLLAFGGVGALVAAITVYAVGCHRGGVRAARRRWSYALGALPPFLLPAAEFAGLELFPSACSEIGASCYRGGEPQPYVLAAATLLGILAWLLAIVVPSFRNRSATHTGGNGTSSSSDSEQEAPARET